MIKHGKSDTMSQSAVITPDKDIIKQNMIVNLTLLLLCLVPVLLSFMLVTNGEANALKFGNNYYYAGVPCFFRSITGYNCLTCGMTRCFIYMSDFNLTAAWNMNVAGVLLYLFCVLQIPYRLVLILRPRIIIPRLIMLFQYIFLGIICTVTVTQFVVQFFVNKS